MSKHIRPEIVFKKSMPSSLEIRLGHLIYSWRPILTYKSRQGEAKILGKGDALLQINMHRDGIVRFLKDLKLWLLEKNNFSNVFGLYVQILSLI